jgi:type IV secretion system protein TrbL
LIAGGPQLGAGAAVGTGLAAAGIGAAGIAATAGGLAAAGGAIAGTARAGAAVAGGASAAYRTGGAAGVAQAAGSVAMSPLRRAAASLRESFASGERAVMRGGARPSSAAAGASASTDSAPAWAQRMKRSQTINRGVSAADHAIRSGDRPSGGHQVDLSDGE